jgi:hypothetical protein
MAAPSSANVSAPASVSAPPSTQAASIQAGDGSARATSDGVRKMPDPMAPPRRDEHEVEERQPSVERRHRHASECGNFART